MKEDEAVDAALRNAARNEDGSVDEKALIDDVAALLDFDEDQERRNKATRAIKRRRSPGHSTPDGQIAIPGMEPYAYEPNRLVADNEGHVVEQAKCRPHFKRAEAERARDKAIRQAVWANRKTQESESFAGWSLDQAVNGRPASELTFGSFVLGAGFWREAGVDTEPEQDQSDED